MSGSIAVINAGSSSIKFSVYAPQDGGLRLDVRGQVEGIGARPRFVAEDARGEVKSEKSWDTAIEHDVALDHVMEFLGGSLAAVGHRVVHGGLEFSAPVRIDARVADALAKFVPLAPLHQPHNLAPIRRLLERSPRLAQVACFDTAFHRPSPEIAQRFALPERLHREGVLRYGFHGLSYEYIASVLPQYDGRAASGRTVVAHLGNGASVCALQAGRSVATSMGFTALDGLPMGTRCGSLDPGVMLYLMDEHGMDARALENLLYHHSGLLGVSGVSSDMRELLASKEPQARLAVELFVYRIGRELGSLAAALGGLDAIVFTAGIGEHAAEVRARVVRDAAWLGVRLNSKSNSQHKPLISAARSRVSAWVIPTDEELMIARHTRRLLGI